MTLGGSREGNIYRKVRSLFLPAKGRVYFFLLFLKKDENEA